jgi:cell division protein FtsB
MGNFIKNAILSVIIIALTISLIKNYQDSKIKQQILIEYQNEVIKLKNEDKKLQAEIKKSSDSRFVEEEARNKLNLIKKNEVSLIVPKLTITPTPAPTRPIPNWQKWYNLLLR